MTTQSPVSIDGRRARRERGRLAVSEAMIDLVFEGHVPPTADQIAERAGVSIASLFRYFETLDELRRGTTELYFERHGHLFEVTEIGEGSIDQRVDRFVSSRATLYETTEPMCRLVRMRANEFSEVGDMLGLMRVGRADQIRHHFDTELSRLAKADRDDLVAVIVTLTSFESWDQMCHSHDRSHSQIRKAWTTALHRIL